MTEQTQPIQGELSFRRLISTGVAAKLLVDTQTQIFSPFLPMIAAGLGIDVITLGRLLGLRNAVGIVSPLFGTLADRRGYRLIIQLGLLLTAGGVFLIGSSQSLWMAALGMALCGLGMSSFLPTLQAYISARLPYTQRARALGMIEYSWALTGIVGLSAIGWLIEVTNWRVPFFLLSVGMLIMLFVFRQMTGREEQPKVQTPADTIQLAGPTWRQIGDFFDLGSNARSAYSNIFAGSLTFFAAYQIMLIYGAWLSDQYKLDAVHLGTVALFLGFFDLAASVSVSLFTDRIGKRRSVLLGNLGALAGYCLMPFLNVSVILAVLGIAIARSCFEFTIVSHFPLLSEQVPAQRGKVLTFGSAGTLSAGTVASFTAPWLYTHYGAGGVCLLSLIAVCGAIALILIWVKEHAA